MTTETIHGFELMRAIQDSNSFTQQEMADKLEINQSNLSRILSGERRISRKLAARLEQVFRVPTNQFTDL